MGRRTVRLLEADLATVKASDFVSWPGSSGEVKGRVLSLHKGKVPAVPMKVTGTLLSPAARVEVYKEADGGGWKGTGTYVGLDATVLSKIDDLAEPTTEARVTTEGSFDAIRQSVQAAITDRLQQLAASIGGSSDRVYCYVSDIGPDWAVYCSGYDDDYYRVDYSLDAAGAVTLGDPVEVRQVRSYEQVPDPDAGTVASAVTPPAAAPAAQATTEATERRSHEVLDGRLLEAKGTDSKTGGRIFGVKIVGVGDSKNGRRYTKKTLEAAAPLYEGAKAFDHHRTDDELKSSTINGLVGSYRSVEAKTDGLYGELVLLPGATHTAETLDASLEAQAQGLPPLVGISHDVMATYKPVLEGGKRLIEATQIVAVNSADVVANPSAGGQATRFVAGGIDNKEGTEMDLEELLALLTTATPEQLAAAGLEKKELVGAGAPAGGGGGGTGTEGTQTTQTTEAVMLERDSGLGKLLVERTLEAAKLPTAAEVVGLIPAQFTEADLDGAVAGIKTLLSGLEKTGLIPTVPAGEVLRESLDKKVEALDAMFAQDYSKGYRSLKEAFVDITGITPKFGGSEDFNRRILRESIGNGGYDSGYEDDGSVRTTESLTTASWTTILGDSITRRMVAEYQSPALQSWRKMVSQITPVTDFRTQRVERMGGYGVLPAVAQGAAYTALTSPTNEEFTYAITKRGGTEDLTLETIANDDLRAVQRIPVKLGRAAAQTLLRFVWDTLQNNPTIYDTTALFVAGHNNLDAASPLSQSTLSVGRRRIRQQAAYGDASDVLSFTPKYLVVPSSLEEIAYQLCTSAVAIPATPAGPSNTPNIHAGLEPVVLDYFTSQTQWFLLADPEMCPTFELGFYQGKQDPEMFMQTDPLLGNVFTNDKVTYKIRHIYSGAVADFRPYYRGN